MRLTQLNEQKQKLALERLQADRSDYQPFLSKESIDIHYGKLAKGYVFAENKTIYDGVESTIFNSNKEIEKLIESLEKVNESKT